MPPELEQPSKESHALPLFRPGVAPGRQWRLEGEMLRIRPLSPALLAAVAGAALLCLLGLFQLGRSLP